MTVGQAVALRIEQLCEQYNLTLNKLANICGITQSTLNNIVNTGSKNPTVSTVKKICDGLNISLSDFFNTELFNNLEQEIK